MPRRTTTGTTSSNEALYAFDAAKRAEHRQKMVSVISPKNAPMKNLVKGAFLHDFYLYDWHNCSNITHWHSA